MSNSTRPARSCVYVALTLTVTLVGIAICPTRAAAQNDAPVATPYSVVTPEVDQAVTRGLSFLATQQQPDGSFKGMGQGRSVAVPALTGLTFLASGSTARRGKYAQNLPGVP